MEIIGKIILNLISSLLRTSRFNSPNQETNFDIFNCITAATKVKPAAKASFVYGCKQMTLIEQENAKWRISFVYASKPMITVTTAIQTHKIFRLRRAEANEKYYRNFSYLSVNQKLLTSQLVYCLLKNVLAVLCPWLYLQNDVSLSRFLLPTRIKRCDSSP